MKKNINLKKQFLLVIAILAGVIIYESVVIYDTNENKLSVLTNDNEMLKNEILDRDSVVNELMSSFDEIEQNLKFVREKRKQLTIDANKEGKNSTKQAVVDDIKLMNQMLEESSQKIDNLEKKLKNSNIRLSSFRKKIANLTQNIEEQNTQIAMLQSQVKEKDFQLAELSTKLDTMHEKVSNMAVVINQKTDTLQQKQQELSEKTEALNKAYLTCGTSKELKETGVISKEGGFLGIGKRSSVQTNLDNEDFVKLDIRETKTIPIHSGKAMLLSEHPDSSYNFIEENGQIAYLEIENPDEFWRISKYAIIEIK